jgi:hypothetical protein
VCVAEIIGPGECEILFIGQSELFSDRYLPSMEVAKMMTSMGRGCREEVSC